MERSLGIPEWAEGGISQLPGVALFQFCHLGLTGDANMQVLFAGRVEEDGEKTGAATARFPGPSRRRAKSMNRGEL